MCEFDLQRAFAGLGAALAGIVVGVVLERRDRLDLLGETL